MKDLSQTGVHIGFCGIDGAGKSTQAILLCRWMKECGINAIVYEERRNFVSEITDTIARKKGLPSGRVYLGEQLYMMSISFEVLKQNMLNIRPYTASGQSIVSSRTIFDWLAGAMTRGCRQPEFDFIKEIILFKGVPDLTIWLDTTPRVAQERVVKRQFDTANLNYLANYRQSFESLLNDYPHHKISGNADIQTIHSEIKNIAEKFLT